MKTRFSIVAAALVVLGTGNLTAQQRSGQEIGDARVVDYGFGFELARPSPRWRVGGEQTARRIVAESVAASFDDETGTFLVVLVEPSGEVGLVEMARFMIDGLPVEQKTVELLDTITYQDLPAVRFVVTGQIDGIDLRMGNTIVANRGFIYQVIAVGLRGFTSGDGPAFEALWDTFSFRPGETVPGRSLIRPVTEAAGVGWQLVDGAFLSAAFGIAAQPTLPGWHVVVGDELEAMNPYAAVALLSESPGITVLAIPERVTGIDGEVLAAGLERRFGEEQIGAQPFRELTVDLAGRRVELDLYEQVEAGEPMDFLHGVIRHGEYATQLVGWWESNSRAAVLEQLAAALRQMQFFDEAGRLTLAARLTMLHPQNAVGAGWSLRHGVYTDFAYDFVWTKPTGFWRIHTGEAARDHYPGARLALRAVSYEIEGVLRVARSAGAEGRGWFAEALAELVPAEHAALSEEPVRRELNGVEVYELWFDLNLDDMAYRHLLITAVAGDRVFDLLIWGPSPVVAAHPEIVWAAVDALTITDLDLQAVVIAAGRYTDRRLGFTLSAPASDWAVEVLTPPHLSRRGAVVQVSPDALHGVVVFALGATDEDQEVVWFDEIAAELGLASFRRAAGISLQPATETTFRDLPAERVAGTLPDGTEIGERLTFQRDGIIYRVAAFSLDGEGPPPSELLDAFQLADPEASR